MFFIDIAEKIGYRQFGCGFERDLSHNITAQRMIDKPANYQPYAAKKLGKCGYAEDRSFPDHR
jgi:hypothetical protein